MLPPIVCTPNEQGALGARLLNSSLALPTAAHSTPTKLTLQKLVPVIPLYAGPKAQVLAPLVAIWVIGVVRALEAT